jgi:asparagine synthetase B (glutamine-hydrolysing)
VDLNIGMKKMTRRKQEENHFCAICKANIWFQQKSTIHKRKHIDKMALIKRRKQSFFRRYNFKNNMANHRLGENISVKVLK